MNTVGFFASEMTVSENSLRLPVIGSTPALRAAPTPQPCAALGTLHEREWCARAWEASWGPRGSRRATRRE
jgi:hypothetical protein